MQKVQGLIMRRAGAAVLEPPIVHGEAFHLMKYVDPDKGVIEWLWNSRDGVTPFGLEFGFNHADWEQDVFVPNFVPPIGMRIFMSWRDAPATYKAEAAERWAERLKQYQEQGMTDAQLDTARAGAPFGYRDTDPCVVTVDAALHSIFHDIGLHTPFVPAA